MRRRFVSIIFFGFGLGLFIIALGAAPNDEEDSAASLPHDYAAK